MVQQGVHPEGEGIYMRPASARTHGRVGRRITGCYTHTYNCVPWDSASSERTQQRNGLAWPPPPRLSLPSEIGLSSARQPAYPHTSHVDTATPLHTKHSVNH